VNAGSNGPRQVSPGKYDRTGCQTCRDTRCGGQQQGGGTARTGVTRCVSGLQPAASGPPGCDGRSHEGEEPPPEKADNGDHSSRTIRNRRARRCEAQPKDEASERAVEYRQVPERPRDVADRDDCSIRPLDVGSHCRVLGSHGSASERSRWRLSGLSRRWFTSSLVGTAVTVSRYDRTRGAFVRGPSPAIVPNN